MTGLKKFPQKDIPGELYPHLEQVFFYFSSIYCLNFISWDLNSGTAISGIH